MSHTRTYSSVVLHDTSSFDRMRKGRHLLHWMFFGLRPGNGRLHAALWELNPLACLYWLDSEWKTEDWMCSGHFENCIAERSQKVSVFPRKVDCHALSNWTSSATPGVASRGLGKSPVRPFAVQWGPRRKDLRLHREHRDGIVIAHKPLPGFHNEKNLQNLKTLLAANPQNRQSFKNS